MKFRLSSICLKVQDQYRWDIELVYFGLCILLILWRIVSIICRRLLSCLKSTCRRITDILWNCYSMCSSNTQLILRKLSHYTLCINLLLKYPLSNLCRLTHHYIPDSQWDIANNDHCTCNKTEGTISIVLIKGKSHNHWDMLYTIHHD